MISLILSPGSCMYMYIHVHVYNNIIMFCKINMEVVLLLLIPKVESIVHLYQVAMCTSSMTLQCAI